MKHSIICLFLLLLSFLLSAECTHYSPYSVTVKSFKAEKTLYSPGETVKADFTLQNSFSVPLSEISLTALVKKGGNIFGQQSFNAPSLLANASTPLSFYWKIPRGAADGTYSIELHAYSNGRSVGGHAYSPGTFAGSASFEVQNPFENYAFIESNATKISGENIEVAIANIGGEANGIVLFELMAGEEPKHLKLASLLEEGRIPFNSPLGQSLASASNANALLNKNNVVLLKTNSSTRITRALPTLPNGFYLLKITLIKENGKSIALLPITVGERAEILFVSPTSFPTNANENASATACVAGNSFSNKTLTLRARSNNQPSETSAYSIQTSPIPQEFSVSFTPAAFTEKLFIEAKLFDENNALIDFGKVLFDYAEFEKETLFFLNASVSREKISYSIIVSDEFGQPAQASVDVLIFREGELKEIISGLNVRGTLSSDYTANETGEYSLTAIIPETHQQAIISVNVSSVPEKPKPLPPFQPTPTQPKIDYTSLLVIMFVVLSIILVLFFWKAGKR